MKQLRQILPLMITAIIAMTVISACSTQKNNATTRWWHSFTAKYNTYYNGTLAYIDGSVEKENGNKDNFTEMLPLYTVGNKNSVGLGKGKFDVAIEKSQKTIRLHSINKRPEWKKNRKKTERDIEWLNRKEYNPFLWKAWMLMGRSQFHQGAFDEAISTFTYMSRLYRTQPAIYGKAQAWLAKCYIQQDWLYDAEDIIRNISRDSIDSRARKEWDYTLADYYLHTGDLAKAADYLRKVVKHEMRSKQRAREYYLLGQVEAALGHHDLAYKAFRKVISQNPAYEVAFNARIAMSEVLADGGQGKKMIGRLKRMARNDNNKDYLDQVYYAMGNIYLAQKDTANAISAYEKGNTKATRSGVEKGVLLLHLGDLYWQMEKYGDAQRCYGEAIGLLDKERKDYQQLADRSKVLDELVPYTDAIHLQDSLQSLARMSEKDRNQAIDRVIAALKKKEKEEKDREAEAYAQKQQSKNNTGMSQQNMPQRQTNTSKSSAWYFYNATTVQQGKQAFERRWGKRENVDDWQRSNKTVVGSLGMDSADVPELSQEQLDSISAAEAKAEKEKERMDSAVNDPHKREYYLAQIPFSEEQLQQSNELIKDGLYHSGIIFKDKLDNLPLSEKAFARLIKDFPDFEPMDEVLYHLFLLYSRKGEPAVAQQQIEALKARYPESTWTAILTDPYFEENARFGEHIEDSLYASTYDAFLADNSSLVKANTKISDTRFPMGANRDKFMFISGLSMLNEGDIDGCLDRLKQLVKDFPQGKPSEMAGMIINGVNAGKRLYGAKFDMTDVWNRRTALMADSDSISRKQFSVEPNVPFTFMLVYEPDSVNENRLLYQLARFNFTNFVVRNFDIELTEDHGLHRMNVSGFRSHDEARLYARVLYQNEAVKAMTTQCRPVIISEENIPLLGDVYSYNDYDTFYVAHFQPLEIKREYMLYEPDAAREPKLKKEPLPALPSESAAPGGVAPVEEKKEDADADDTLEDNGDNTILNEEIIALPEEEEKEEIIALPEETQKAENEEIITLSEEQEKAEQEEIITLPEETLKEEEKEEIIILQQENKKEDNEEIIILDEEQKSSEDEEIIILDDKEETNEKEEEIVIDDRKDSEELEDEYYELDGF